ncbi:superoxide dismutase family protein [Nonomuraea sp. NPDC050328]|uniref:superoxide dismutase family protein n=1 Tax=Nonomuraea sp. NPDC050328 TaxID=3364361 RepID=UPI0037B64516
MTTPRLLTLTSVLVLAAGCAAQQPVSGTPAHAPAHTGPAHNGSAQPGSASGVRLAGGDLVVYDRALAPEGARASASVDSTATGTVSSLTVEGLLPQRTYGAHLHANACGAKPDDAGPHFQHTHGQANATSEVWLDLTTDEAGTGQATAKHSWSLGAMTPKSAVIHAQPTKPDGTAGPRVACLSLG